jgi:hypothetical protein
MTTIVAGGASVVISGEPPWTAPARCWKLYNMSVEAILQTHPRRPLVIDAAVLARCVDECGECAAYCTICADASLAEDEVRDLERCVRLCLDCADACVAIARILARQLDPEAAIRRRQLEACLIACGECAEECERHAHHHEHCRLCADECRRCERACRDLLAALAPV